MTNAVKQANEFGITASGQTIAALLVNLPDIHALGLQNAQGLTFTESFYWDMAFRQGVVGTLLERGRSGPSASSHT